MLWNTIEVYVPIGGKKDMNITLKAYKKILPSAYQRVEVLGKMYSPLTEWFCLVCSHGWLDRLPNNCPWCLSSNEDQIVQFPEKVMKVIEKNF